MRHRISLSLNPGYGLDDKAKAEKAHSPAHELGGRKGGGYPRLTVRAFLSISAIAALTLALLPFQWLAVRMRWPMRRRIPTLYHGLVCRVLGVRITTIGRRIEERPLLIVANHTSWLDISVITAVAPVVFVAKREVATWPIFGLLARLQRSVFVDRARRHKTQKVNSEIARRLADRDPVVLFAEGTSSDGNRVLAFRTALIGSAGEAIAEAGHIERVWIQPLSVAYAALVGLPLDRRSRCRVAWYGGASLLPHLRQLVARGAIDVTVSWGTPVAFDEFSDRKAVAARLEGDVRAMTVAALRGRRAAPADEPCPGASDAARHQRSWVARRSGS